MKKLLFISIIGFTACTNKSEEIAIELQRTRPNYEKFIQKEEGSSWSYEDAYKASFRGHDYYTSGLENTRCIWHDPDCKKCDSIRIAEFKSILREKQ